MTVQDIAAHIRAAMAVQLPDNDSNPRDFEDNLNNFINKARVRIEDTAQQLGLHMPYQLATVTLDLCDGRPYCEMPEDMDFIRTITAEGNATPSEPVRKGQLAAIEGLYTTPGKPRFYDWANQVQIRLAPTPADGYTLTINYVRQPVQLSNNTSARHWLLINAQQALQNGGCYFAALFLRDNGMVGQEAPSPRYQMDFENDIKGIMARVGAREGKDISRVAG